MLRRMCVRKPPSVGAARFLLTRAKQGSPLPREFGRRVPMCVANLARTRSRGNWTRLQKGSVRSRCSAAPDFLRSAIAEMLTLRRTAFSGSGCADEDVQKWHEERLPRRDSLRVSSTAESLLRER